MISLICRIWKKKTPRRVDTEMSLVVAGGKEVWESKRLKGSKSQERKLPILKWVSHRGVIQPGEYTQQRRINCVWWQMVRKLTMVVILQFIDILQRSYRLASRHHNKMNITTNQITLIFSFSSAYKRYICTVCAVSSVQFSRPVVSDSLQPHESQQARPPCPSPTPGVYSNSCAWSRWCHPTLSSFVVPFSSCHQSFPASGSFPMSQLFALGGQSIGVSASASVLPMNIQDWPPLGWTGWISLQYKGLSRVFSNTTVQKHQCFGAQLSS